MTTNTLTQAERLRAHEQAHETMQRVWKARTELLQTTTFYAVALSHIDPVISNRVPTAATNGAQHFWNPAFVAKLSQKHLLTTQKHELEHDTRRHHSRRGGRDPELWNIACDYAINIDLVDAGDELPPGALVDAKYRDMSAEDIYRTRELDRQAEEKKRQQEQAQQQQGDESDDADTGNGAGDDDGQDERDEDEAGDQGDANESGNDGQEKSGSDISPDADGGNGETGADEVEQEAAELGGGGGEADDDNESGAGDQGDDSEEGGDAEGAGEAQDAAEGDDVGEGSPAGGNASQGEPDADGDANGGGQLPGSSDPGGMGAVLDAGDTAAELSDADARWERVLRQAASLATKRGDKPGHVTREIGRADHPPADWRDTLRDWFDHGATTVESWSRPNRRLIASGLYLPGRVRDGINRAVFAIDTSGSMFDGVALECVAVETQAALDEGIIDEVIVLYGDVRVTRVDTYKSGDQIEFDPRGGGGTELAPMFAYVRDQIEDPTLMVVFTDGFIDDVASHGPPPCPVLWAYTGYPQHVKSHMANTPWGEPAIDVGTH